MALLDHLKIPKADLVGHSFGGACAIRAAIQHPNKVRRLVVISSPHARSAWYPEVQNGSCILLRTRWQGNIMYACTVSIKYKPRR